MARRSTEHGRALATLFSAVRAYRNGSAPVAVDVRWAGWLAPVGTLESSYSSDVRPAGALYRSLDELLRMHGRRDDAELVRRYFGIGQIPESWREIADRPPEGISSGLHRVSFHERLAAACARLAELLPPRRADHELAVEHVGAGGPAYLSGAGPRFGSKKGVPTVVLPKEASAGNVVFPMPGWGKRG